MYKSGGMVYKNTCICSDPLEKGKMSSERRRII